MTSLGTLSGQPYSYGQAVSGDGSMVVGYASDGSVEELDSGSIVSTGHAFLWTQTLGMVDLNNYLPTLGNINLSGWELREARGISADGSTIVGLGMHNGAPKPGSRPCRRAASCRSLRWGWRPRCLQA